MKDGVKDVEEIDFNELMKVLLKYNEGPRKESSKVLRNLARSFQGSRILSSDEIVQVCIWKKTQVEGDLILSRIYTQFILRHFSD